MAESTGWIITISEDERPIADILHDLSNAGFVVSQVLEEIGSITGTADPVVVDELRAIPGVVDVAPETRIDIGPPDAPIS